MKAEMLIKATKANAEAPPIRNAVAVGRDGALLAVGIGRSFLFHSSCGTTTAVAAVGSAHDVVELSAKPRPDVFGHRDIAPPVGLALRRQDGGKIARDPFQSGHGFGHCLGHGAAPWFRVPRI
jgi:hypothetical protein